MIINGREVIIQPGFDEMLDAILAYFLRQGEDQFARKFVKELYEVIELKIAKQPEIYPEYKWKPSPEKRYRRYLYRKKYYVVYKVFPKSIEILAVVYSKRDLSQIQLE